MIALLTGVLNEAMFEKNMLRLEEDRFEREMTCGTLVDCCGVMFDSIGQEHLVEDGEVRGDGVRAMLPEIAELFEEHRVAYTHYDLEAMVSVMDTDGSGAINRTEFCRGILQMAQDIRPMLVMELHHEGMAFHKSKAAAIETSVLRLQQQLSELLRQQLRELPEQLSELLLAELADVRRGPSPHAHAPPSLNDAAVAALRRNRTNGAEDAAAAEYLEAALAR